MNVAAAPSEVPGLVSVAIPSYNRAYCIERAVDSVLGQTYPHVEAVVVDDGSTDETPAVMERRYGGDPRVRYIRQPNGGVSAARNTAFGHARGEFVAFLDSDDEWLPHKVELQVACLRRFPELGMVWTDMEAIGPDGRVFSPRYIREMYSAFAYFGPGELFTGEHALSDIVPSAPEVVGDARLRTGMIFSQMIAGSMVHTSTVLLRASVRREVGEFEVAWRSGEDYAFHLRTCRLGPVGFLDLPTIRYQRGMPDALTRREYRVERASNFLRTILPYIEHDRDAIRLSPQLLREVVADAHAWLADAELEAGQRVEGRRHAWQSLRHDPRQPRLAMLALVSYLPPPAVRMLRSAWRTVRGKGPVSTSDTETVGVPKGGR